MGMLTIAQALGADRAAHTRSPAFIAQAGASLTFCTLVVYRHVNTIVQLWAHQDVLVEKS